MSGRKPGVKHLRVFGCVGYTHIPSEKRKKLDNPGKVSIFLGYGLMEKGYRMLDVASGKVEISRDVRFEENAHWNFQAKKVEYVHVLHPFKASEPVSDPSTSAELEDGEEPQFFIEPSLDKGHPQPNCKPPNSS